MLVNMAQNRQLPGKLGEQEFINLLESLNQQQRKQTTVKVCNQYKCTLNIISNNLTILNFILLFQFDRRRAALDSDDDMDL